MDKKETNTIVNRVAQSGIITLDLSRFAPNEKPLEIDLKTFLFKELILKEKDFREAVKTLDNSPYQDRLVALYCSTDAIIPAWAYMLLVSRLQGVAKEVRAGSSVTVYKQMFLNNIKEHLSPEQFADKRVVLKGCSDIDLPQEAYLLATQLLHPHVKSLMYGEPCSTVPVYKRK